MQEVSRYQRAETSAPTGDVFVEHAGVSLDAALSAVKRRATTTGCRMEDTAVAIVAREVRFSPQPAADRIDYRDAVVVVPRSRRTETLRCDWQSDMQGHAWPRTVHS